MTSAVCSTVAGDDALVHLIIGEALLLQLGDVVIAENSGGGGLEAAAVERSGDKDASARPDRRRPAVAGHGRDPRDILGR